MINISLKIIDGTTPELIKDLSQYFIDNLPQDYVNVHIHAESWSGVVQTAMNINKSPTKTTVPQ